MKNSILKQIMILAVAILAVSCLKPDVTTGSGNENQTGKLVLSEISVSEDVRDVAHKTRAGVSTDKFKISIYSTVPAKTHFYGAYSALKPKLPMELPLGSHFIFAESHTCKNADWDNVYYKGEQSFEIKRDETYTLDNFVCKVANIITSVGFTDSMKDIMGSDCKVSVKVGTFGPLVFGVNETRRGTFKPADEANTLVWEFQGTLDGEYYSETHFIQNVKAGEHRALMFDVKKVPDPNSGGAKFTFSVSPECDTYDMNLNLDVVEEDIIEPFEPAIKITSDYSLTETNTLKASDMPINDLGLVVSAQEGITNLTVEITTDNVALTAAMAAQGISGAFDLVSPGAALEPLLQGLGFPTGAEVSGKKMLDLNLSGILPMVFSQGNTEQFDIQIKVHDVDGNIDTKTLCLKLIDDSIPYALTIVGDNFDIDQVMVIPFADKDNTAVKVDFTATEGIKSLVVDITTESANFEGALKEFKFLGGFDLVAPGELEGSLRDLDLPCGDAVKDKTALPFDISSFITLIAGYTSVDEADVVANFGVTITDNKGNTESKSIMLKILKEELKEE